MQICGHVLCVKAYKRSSGAYASTAPWSCLLRAHHWRDQHSALNTRLLQHWQRGQAYYGGSKPSQCKAAEQLHNAQHPCPRVTAGCVGDRSVRGQRCGECECTIQTVLPPDPSPGVIAGARNHQVCGLQVPMDNSRWVLLVVKVSQASCGINSYFQRSPQCKYTLRSKGVCQRAPGHELCDQKVGLLLGTAAQELHRVWMMHSPHDLQPHLNTLCTAVVVSSAGNGHVQNPLSSAA